MICSILNVEKQCSVLVETFSPSKQNIPLLIRWPQKNGGNKTGVTHQNLLRAVSDLAPRPLGGGAAAPNRGLKGMGPSRAPRASRGAFDLALSLWRSTDPCLVQTTRPLWRQDALFSAGQGRHSSSPRDAGKDIPDLGTPFGSTQSDAKSAQCGLKSALEKCVENRDFLSRDGAGRARFKPYEVF